MKLHDSLMCRSIIHRIAPETSSDRKRGPMNAASDSHLIYVFPDQQIVKHDRERRMP
jgi:hypothetical protein